MLRVQASPPEPDRLNSGISSALLRLYRQKPRKPSEWPVLRHRDLPKHPLSPAWNRQQLHL